MSGVSESSWSFSSLADQVVDFANAAVDLHQDVASTVQDVSSKLASGDFDALADMATEAANDVIDVVQEAVSIENVLDALPPGVDEGAAKMIQAYQVAALVAMVESGADLESNPAAELVERI
jgi:hypothetical protein